MLFFLNTRGLSGRRQCDGRGIDLAKKDCQMVVWDMDTAVVHFSLTLM